MNIMGNMDYSGALGVLGGMGPLATATFFEIVVQRTQAEIDQDHLNIIIYNMPHIPNRTDHILGKSADSPAPHIRRHIEALKSQNVTAIAIPCVTATYYYEEITDQLETIVINTLDEITKHVLAKNAKKVGLMATDGTINSRLFQKHLEKHNVECIVPDETRQRLVMQVIDDVKAGREVNMADFYSVSTSLTERGCDAIVLGCTELPVVNKRHSLDPELFIDTLIVLADASITRCGKQVKV